MSCKQRPNCRCKPCIQKRIHTAHAKIKKGALSVSRDWRPGSTTNTNDSYDVNDFPDKAWSSGFETNRRKH